MGASPWTLGCRNSWSAECCPQTGGHRGAFYALFELKRLKHFAIGAQVKTRCSIHRLVTGLQNWQTEKFNHHPGIFLQNGILSSGSGDAPIRKSPQFRGLCGWLSYNLLLYINYLDWVAEGEGFEPSNRVTPITDLANQRLQPLGHPSARPCTPAGGGHILLMVGIRPVNVPSTARARQMGERDGQRWRCAIWVSGCRAQLSAHTR